ncbi:MAG: peptidylprolyl isomerase [Rhizomicrobium sp.]
MTPKMFQNLLRIGVAMAVLGFGSGATPAPLTLDGILAASPHSDWRPIDPANTLVMQLPGGPVVIELAPGFAPHTVANIKTLVRGHYFDGSAIVRVQDNFVVQWSRTDHRSLGSAKSRIAPEFDRALRRNPGFIRLSDPDTYAPQMGFLSGFPVARDHGREWLTHCYGMVGVGRDNAADSGNGSELYAVIGQSPRNLDRNVTLVGRVVQGIELLSALPRGTGALGFYQNPSRDIPVAAIRVGSDLPPSRQPHLEALRTDSRTFRALIEERRTRPDPWYIHSPGHVGLCNVPLPVREISHKR